MGLFDKIKAGLNKTREMLVGGLQSVASVLPGRLQLDARTLDSLEEQLLRADVGLPTAERLLADLRKRSGGAEDTTAAQVCEWLAESIAVILREAGSGPLDLPREPCPAVLLMVGVNGVGKTTTLGKLAHRFASEGRKVLLVACDTFRAGAGEQLEIWSKRAGCDVLRQKEGADPAAVAFDGVQAALARHYDVALFDTAGRLHNKANLMMEMAKIRRVIERAMPGAPHETWMVLDAVTGQNGLAQARQFSRDAGVTGLVVTKLDGTARGGIVVAIAHELKLPVRWIGVGEGLDDLVPFDPDAFARGLFGLAERAKS